MARNYNFSALPEKSDKIYALVLTFNTFEFLDEIHLSFMHHSQARQTLKHGASKFSIGFVCKHYNLIQWHFEYNYVTYCKEYRVCHNMVKCTVMCIWYNMIWFFDYAFRNSLRQTLYFNVPVIQPFRTWDDKSLRNWPRKKERITCSEMPSCQRFSSWYELNNSSYHTE